MKCSTVLAFLLSGKETIDIDGSLLNLSEHFVSDSDLGDVAIRGLRIPYKNT